MSTINKNSSPKRPSVPQPDDVAPAAASSEPPGMSGATSPATRAPHAGTPETTAPVAVPPTAPPAARIVVTAAAIPNFSAVCANAAKWLPELAAVPAGKKIKPTVPNVHWITSNVRRFLERRPSNRPWITHQDAFREWRDDVKPGRPKPGDAKRWSAFPLDLSYAMPAVGETGMTAMEMALAYYEGRTSRAANLFVSDWRDVANALPPTTVGASMLLALRDAFGVTGEIDFHGQPLSSFAEGSVESLRALQHQFLAPLTEGEVPPPVADLQTAVDNITANVKKIRQSEANQKNIDHRIAATTIAALRDHGKNSARAFRLSLKALGRALPDILKDATAEQVFLKFDEVHQFASGVKARLQLFADVAALESAVLDAWSAVQPSPRSPPALVQVLSTPQQLEAIAQQAGLNAADVAQVLLRTAKDVPGWKLLPWRHDDMVIPGELAILASGHGFIPQLFVDEADAKHAEMELQKYLNTRGYLPKITISFTDQVVPSEAQKHLVGRHKILGGDDVLRLYAAATAQPKWLAHEELHTHEPRPAVLEAIGAFVGLSADEVKTYFDGGGWGRLFGNGAAEPLVFVNAHIYPGQLVTEYLQVAGTAAPTVLDDFLKAQTEQPAVDPKTKKPVPFPVSETALDQVFNNIKSKLDLSFKDPDSPNDLGLQALRESQAKHALKQWFEQRYFLSQGKGQPQQPPLLAPKCDAKGPIPPVSQVSFTPETIVGLVEADRLGAAVRYDVLATVMQTTVPGPQDTIALSDGSLLLDGFLSLVAKASAQQQQLEQNPITVTADLLKQMDLYEKNTAQLLPVAAPPDAAVATVKTAMQQLEDMDAPPDVKAIMSQIFSKARAEKERLAAGVPPLGFSAHARLEGNPGTGKTTTARVIVEGVRESGLLPKPKDTSVTEDVLETTGRELMRLAKEGKLEDFFLNKAHGRGVLLDELYQVDLQTEEGRAVADFLLTFLENHRTNTIVFVAGYADKLNEFFASNPGFNSRFKYTAKFPDLSDDKLQNVLQKMVRDKGFSVDNALAQRAIRHLTKFRGEGFGNARSVRNQVENAIEAFINAGGSGVGGTLLPEHFFGDPKAAIQAPSQARARLQKREGLQSVKDKFAEVDKFLFDNVEREELGMKPLPISLHAAFLGNPGTGKTSVADDYGLFLKERGLLAKGDVIRVKREDLVGSHEGDTERKVKEVIERAKGCVLFIDEAYTLHGDPYGNRSIDLLVGSINGDPRDEYVLMMAGYTQEMSALFDNANRGLSRRLAQRFIFEDYDNQALKNILRGMATDREMIVDDATLDAMVEQLSRERQRPNFGNAGAAGNLLTAVGEAAATRRQSQPKAPADWSLEAKRAHMAQVVIDDVQRAIVLIKQRGAVSTRRLSELIGVEPMKLWVRRLEMGLHGAIRRGTPPPPAPYGVAVVGPRGAGKSAVASTIATELDRLKLLGGAETQTINARELLAGYVNQTVPHVNNLLKSALGRVLVIKDLGALMEGADNGTVREAIDALGAFLRDHRGRICVVLEGDATGQKLERVLDLGLREYFGQPIRLAAATADEAVQYFQRLLSGAVRLGDTAMQLDAEANIRLPSLIDELLALPGFGSYLDMEKLFEAANEENAIRLAERELAGDDVPADAWTTLTASDLERAFLSLNRVKGGNSGLAHAAPASDVVHVRATAAGTGIMFEVPGAVNGVTADFVVDTGATSVTISPEFAEAIGIDWRNAQPLPIVTASGQDAAYRVVLPDLRVGGLVAHDVEAVVAPTPKNLLGNSFLRHFTLEQRGSDVWLRPAPTNPTPTRSEGPAPAMAAPPPAIRATSRQTAVAVDEPVAELSAPAAERVSEAAKKQVDDFLYRHMAEATAKRAEAMRHNDAAALRAANAEIHQLMDAVRGVVAPALQEKIRTELGLKAEAAQAIAAEIATERARAEEAQRKIKAEMEAQKKRTEWVCGMCGNSNPGCPYNVKNNGIGNIGGAYREVSG